MNPKLENKIYKLGQSVGLTFDEREATRANLLSKIAVSEREVLSPYSPMFYWRYVSMYVKPQYVSFALLAILVIGGVSAAAENALPGEPLYQVKTSVNENVLALFAFTPQSKAQLHTELAVRRLQEVETLAINGTLDASTTATAENKINGNLAVVKDSIKQLTSENNPIAAADASTQAESSLKVHEAILGTISDGNASINASVKEVAMNVGIQTTALSLDRAAIDSKISSTTTSSDILLDQQKNAEDAIAVIQATLATSTGTSTDTGIIGTSTATSTDLAILTVDASTTPNTISTSTIIATSTATSTAAKVKAKIQAASDFLTQGNAKLDAKEYGEAFILFKKAEQAALDGQLLLDPSMSTSVINDTTNDATTTATSTPSVI